jgi:Swi5-dependent recombination DNA repair protein 1
MSTPNVKRRRLNDATKTLQKPFKSPFRTPVRPGIGSDPPSSDPPEAGTPVSQSIQGAPFHSTTDTRHSTASTTQPATPVPSKLRAPKPLPSRPSFATPSRAPTKKVPPKASLTREIVQLRSDLQILTQAQALATSTKDDDLVVLIDRWRTASRAAAEEIFATTRDKVNRMGGVGAWKAREKEGKERQQQWDMEERQAEREKMEEARENGEIGDEAYDRFAEMADENGGQEKEKEVETFKAADDDVSEQQIRGRGGANGLQSFTMDMMLKTLNIDLDLIGYSKEMQRWDG